MTTSPSICCHAALAGSSRSVDMVNSIVARLKDLKVSKLRLLMWALVVRVQARRVIDARGVNDLHILRAPVLGEEQARRVQIVMDRTRARCLVRSIVMQRYLADNGVVRDLVIGTTAPSAGFRAHAWLDGESAEGCTEMLRIPAARD